MRPSGFWGTGCRVANLDWARKISSARRLPVIYLSVERQPCFLVDFAKWNLKAKLPASDGAFSLYAIGRSRPCSRAHGSR